VIAVAVDVPIEIVLELSIMTAPFPEMLVPLKVSAARAGPAVIARTPTMMPTMRGQPAYLSSEDFILELVMFGNDRFDNNNFPREKRNPQGEAVPP
jgi:hypothetical protein